MGRRETAPLNDDASPTLNASPILRARRKGNVRKPGLRISDSHPGHLSFERTLSAVFVIKIIPLAALTIFPYPTQRRIFAVMCIGGPPGARAPIGTLFPSLDFTQPVL